MSEQDLVPNTGGGGGVPSVNGQTGAITIESLGGTIAITNPAPNAINLEASGSGAPTNATYLTLTNNAALTNNRTLAVTANLSMTDGGATNPLTIGTGAFTGDVTTSANSFATTVAKIAGVAVGTPTGTGNVVFSASPTFTGTINAAAMILTGLVYLNGGTLEEAVFSNGNSGTSKAINLDNGNLQSVTITGAVAMTLTTPTHPGKMTLVITQDGTGHVYSIAGLKYPGGTAPSYSTAANKIDVISIIYDGTNFYGMGGIAFA